MTLAELPSAGAISKPHDYKQNVQKKNGLLKNRVLTGKQFEDFRQKIQKVHYSHGEQNIRTTGHQGQKMNTKHVARKNLTEAKLKEAFRIELFQLCKTRTKKSSPDLFDFYKISDGSDMVNDAGRARRADANWRPHDYKQKVQKMKGLLKNWV